MTISQVSRRVLAGFSLLPAGKWSRMLEHLAAKLHKTLSITEVNQHVAIKAETYL